MSVVPDFMNPAEFRAQQDDVLRQQARLEREALNKAVADALTTGTGFLRVGERVDPATIHQQEEPREVPPVPQHDAEGS